jgi:hypothetical protein
VKDKKRLSTITGEGDHRGMVIEIVWEFEIKPLKIKIILIIKIKFFHHLTSQLSIIFIP